MTDHMTVAEAARLVRVTPQRIYRLIQRGRLGSVSVYGRVLVSRRELLDWAKRRKPGRPRKPGKAH